MLFRGHPFLSSAPNILAVTSAILLGYSEHPYLSFPWKLPKSSCLLEESEVLLLKSSLHFACLQISSSVYNLRFFPSSKFPSTKLHSFSTAPDPSSVYLHYLHWLVSTPLKLLLLTSDLHSSHAPKFYQ